MKTKKLLAAALALTMVFGNGINVANHTFIESSVCADAETETAVLDDDVLKLSGEVTTAEVKAFAKNERVMQRIKHITADKGTVLPADCSGLFQGFKAVESITLANADTSKVTDMSFMFMDCSSLKLLDTDKFDTSKVTDMSFMFDDCSSLTSLDLSGFDTSNVTDMPSMFSDCSSLTSLDTSSFDTSNVTDMKGMFQRCSSLKSLDISTFDTSNVTDMSSMFNDCTELTKLDLRNFDTSKVNDMAFMFAGDRQLTTIAVSDKWETGAAEKSEDMFMVCAALRGGRGTVCKDRYDKTYARIDTLETPGYLSRASYVQIADVKLTANAPVAGKSPETALTTNSEGISKVSSVKWYDGSKELTDKDKFTAGKTYTAKFTLYPIESHMFTADTKVTVNGVEAKAASDDFCREVEYTVNFKAEEPASSADSKSSSKSETSSAPKKDSSSNTESKSGASSTPKKDSSSKPDNKKLMKGDVNLDAKINVTDIAMIASHIKGIKALEGDGLANADVNDDEKVNVTDIAMIAAHIKGIKPLV